jgi:hypothetical protein
MVHICSALDELVVPDQSQSLGLGLEIVNGCHRKNSFERVWNSG